MDFKLTNEMLTLQKDDLFMDHSEITKRVKGNYEKHQELKDLNEDYEGLTKAAEEFEGIFINMMLKEMRKTVHDDEGLFPASQGRKIFQEMLDEEVSRDISNSRSLGIADSVINAYENHVSRKPAEQKVDFKV